jgi:hypothetical protein
MNTGTHINKDPFSVTRDGMSQAERWFNTLMPSYVQIDSREIPDMIDFLYGLSKKINYYNDEDLVAGHWEDFFTSDPSLVIILLSRVNLTEFDDQFTVKKNALVNAKTDERAIQALQELMLFAQELYEKMSTARKRFENMPGSPDVDTMLYLLGNHDETGRSLYGFYRHAVQFFPKLSSEAFEPGLKEMASDLLMQDIFFNPELSDKENMVNAIGALGKLFDEILSRLSRLCRAAKEFVAERKYMDRSYPPQTGLLMTFLELYGYVRKRMNGLTQKHLDYYYQDVLGLKPVQLQPDLVHLIADLEDQLPHIQIGGEDLLLADSGKNEEPVYFRPERKQTLSKAKIKSLKTVFLSNYKQINAPSAYHRDVREVQIFKAEPPLFSPVAYFKKAAEYSSWAIMGEDQHDIAQSERTMQDAEPGIAIASPLFYQPEGLRQFTVTMELRSTEFPGLNEYIRNYSEARKGMSREMAEYKLFSKAFRLMYTAGDGWEMVKNHSVKVSDSDKPICTLTLYFELGAPEKAFECYQELVHTDALTTELPVLKLLLNPQVEHYAYSFLHTIQLNRVTINAKVKGFRTVKLQNNVGPLSPMAPFQPFGPQPAIGSFLDIKNSNIFNRYLKDFTIRINWLELPVGPGGFESYYKGYGYKIENDSFKINLSALSAGQYKPDPPIRQDFRLFNSNPFTKELYPVTEITKVDFKKIQFQNNPHLGEEQLFNEPFFRDGAVRFEFCAPGEAFGHRLFPQIFPEVILHNSKKFRKKIPVPNQPYIPLVKTIELDFESEFSEGFKEEQTNDENFQLFHLYPFGYKKLFPGGEQKNYWMMPRFHHHSNLMIGFENVEPNAELSLFFQMEKKGFQHTLYDPDPITWSYMEGDDWIPFKRSDLISDSTGNFINSGIIHLRLPAQISLDNTILPKGLFWIQASSATKHSIYGRVRAIATNGMLATREIKDSPEEQLRLLEPDKIKGFAKSVKGIQSVWQLFPSFDGSPAETKENYYVRVSERLRHKHRPLQIRDLAQVILNAFPQILIVKLFNCKRENFSVIPGVDLLIVLIPREIKDGTSLIEQPHVALSDLFRIKNFVVSTVSPFVKVEVGNAVYERVKVFCKVLFYSNTEADSIVLRRRFIDDVNKYIAPWQYGETANLKIGSTLYKTEFLIYLKNLPYVKYISSFSLVHFSFESDPNKNELSAQVNDLAISSTDVIVSSTPTSVLIPSPYHIIEILREADPTAPQPSGISNLMIGEEFLVAGDPSKEKKQKEDPEDEDAFGLIISHNI